MSFWYLASIYRKYPWGKEEAFKVAADNAAILLKAGIPVFSPITHSHPIAIAGKFTDNDENAVFLKNDYHFMKAAEGLIICEMENWEESE